MILGIGTAPTMRLSSTLRTATARLLLLGLYMIPLCLVLGYVLGWLGLLLYIMRGVPSEPDRAVWTATGFHALRLMLRWSVAAAAVVGPTVVPLLSVIRVVRVGGSTEPPGSVRLEPTDAPELWNMVAELDSRLGTRMSNTSIWLTPHANAAVAVSPPRGRPGAKTLYLGVPLLAGVDREELRAILCHELAHCAGRHHSFGVLAIRGSRKLHNLAEGLDSAMTVTTDMSFYNELLQWNVRGLLMLFRGYRALYDWITRSARHWQEHEADQVAARHVGRDVMRRALRRADETAAAWEAFRQTPISQMPQGQPDELYVSLGRTLSARAGQRSHRLPKGHTSSHPALQKRLAALDAGQEDGPASTGVPSLRLLSSTAEGTRTRWPKLPHPVKIGQKSIPSNKRRQIWRESAPLETPLTVLTCSLFALSAVSYIAEHWPW